MIKTLRKLLKSSDLYLKIWHSPFYQKFNNPRIYRTFQSDFAFYKSLIGNKNTLIFDVGASIGDKSWSFKQLSKQVVLFEPGKDQLRILTARYKKNPKVTIVDTALSATKGLSNYFVFRENLGYSSLSNKHVETTATNRHELSEANVEKRVVNTDTLSSFISRYGQPDYIKIDVEGHEKEVVMGLTAPVPLLSVEANLPDFLEETIEIVRFLQLLSGNRYIFNYAVKNKLELPAFADGKAIETLLRNFEGNFMELYCKLLPPSEV